MSDVLIIGIFMAGVSFGVIATLIYWPWIEPRVLPDDEARDD